MRYKKTRNEKPKTKNQNSKQLIKIFFMKRG